MDEQREQLKRQPLLINPGCRERPVSRGEGTLGERIARDKQAARQSFNKTRGQDANTTQVPDHLINRDWVEPGIIEETPRNEPFPKIIGEPDIEPTEYDTRSDATSSPDPVNKPKHYMLIPDKEVEVIDVIEAAIRENGIPSIRASSYANILKYLLRCGRKGSFLEDLKKARFYLDRWIEQQELKEYNNGYQRD